MTAVAPAAHAAEGVSQPAGPDDESEVDSGPGTPADMCGVLDIPPLPSKATSSKRKISAVIKESRTSTFPYYRSASQSHLSLASASTHPSKRSQLSLPESLYRSPRTNKTAAAVMGMEGSIRQLTEIIQHQMAMPSTVEEQQELRRDLAMRLLQEKDHGLTVDQKTNIVMVFQSNPDAVSTFIKITDDDLRQGWFRKTLGQEEQRE
jgi:hypothetical protein